MRLNNIPTPYNGHTYPSKGEAGYAYYLDQQVKKGKILRWERQWRFELKVNNEVYAVMVVDFNVYTRDGQEVHEFKKSLFTDKFMHDISYWEYCFPNIPYYVVEEDGRGGYTKRTIEQVLGIPKTSPPKPYKKHNWFEILCSWIFHSVASWFVK